MAPPKHSIQDNSPTPKVKEISFFGFILLRRREYFVGETMRVVGETALFTRIGHTKLLLLEIVIFTDDNRMLKISGKVSDFSSPERKPAPASAQHKKKLEIIHDIA